MWFELVRAPAFWPRFFMLSGDEALPRLPNLLLSFSDRTPAFTFRGVCCCTPESRLPRSLPLPLAFPFTCSTRAVYAPVLKSCESHPSCAVHSGNFYVNVRYSTYQHHAQLREIVFYQECSRDW